jgi:hypothetical protein
MLDANQKFAGAEPKFSQELTQIDLMKTLSWYAQNKDNKDAQKYASDYFKKKYKLNVLDVLKTKSPTFGFLCRIISNGGSLVGKDFEWFTTEVEDIKKRISEKVEVEPSSSNTPLANIATSLHESMNKLFFAINSSKTKDVKRLMRVFSSHFQTIRRNIVSQLDMKHFNLEDERVKKWSEDEITIIKDPIHSDKLDQLIAEFNKLVDFVASAKFTTLVSEIRSSEKGMFHEDTKFMNAVVSEVGHNTSIPTYAFHRIFDLIKNKNISYNRLESQITRLIKSHMHNEIVNLFSEFMSAAESLSNRNT